MGNASSSSNDDVLGSSKTRLSSDEMRRLVRVYGTSGDSVSESRGNSRKHSLIGIAKIRNAKRHVVPLSRVLQDVPRNLQPYIVAAIRPFVADINALTLSELAHLGCLWIYPEPRELESSIIRGLLQARTLSSDDEGHRIAETVTAADESILVDQFLEFAYFLYLYLYFPFHPALASTASEDYGDDGLSAGIGAINTRGSTLDASLEGNYRHSSTSSLPHGLGFQQFLFKKGQPSLPTEAGGKKKPTQHGLLRTTVSVLDGKTSSFEIPALTLTPSPARRFTSAIEAFTDFRLMNHSHGNSVEAILAWTGSMLRFLPLTLSLGLKSILLKKRQGSAEACPSDTRRTSGDRGARANLSNAGGPPPESVPQPSRAVLTQPTRCLRDEFSFLLQHLTPEFRGVPWVRLYATWKEGRSFNRFVNEVLYYPGVSVIAIRTTHNQILGACINCPWQESNGRYFGTLDTFLWGFEPRLVCRRASGLSENFVYLNTKNTFYPKGLGFGGKPECFRLWISEDLEDGYCCLSDTTYEAGTLYPGIPNDTGDGSSDAAGFQMHFRLSELEVWVEADKEALRRQKQFADRDERIRLERRQVDRARFADNAFDREYLLEGRFKGS